MQPVVKLTGTPNLTQYCFDADDVAANRWLAWINSICLAFLLIGLAGFRPRPVVVEKKTLPAEEAVATVIEPAVQAVQTIAPDSGSAPSDAPAGGVAVPVTLNSPSIAFSVPTIGNILVSARLAEAPPAQPLQARSPAPTIRHETATVTGTGGSRPAPVYPWEALRAHEQGTVVLLIEVEAAGKVAAVMVKESSGSRRLDQAAVETVKRFWYFDAAGGPRIFESPIVFRIQ